MKGIARVPLGRPENCWECSFHDHEGAWCQRDDGPSEHVYSRLDTCPLPENAVIVGASALDALERALEPFAWAARAMNARGHEPLRLPGRLDPLPITVADLQRAWEMLHQAED